MKTKCALCGVRYPIKYLVQLGYFASFCSDCYKNIENYFCKSKKEQQESDTSSESDMSCSDSD